MSAVFLITAIGPDKQGVLNPLADLIHSHQGKWLSSKMIHLDGRFSSIIKVEVPQASEQALKQVLVDVPELELSIDVKQNTTSAPARSVHIQIDAHDEVELMSNVHQVLASHCVDVEKVKCNRINVPRIGNTVITANLDLLIPGVIDTDTVLRDLDDLQDDLAVEVIVPKAGKNEGWLKALN